METDDSKTATNRFFRMSWNGNNHISVCREPGADDEVKATGLARISQLTEIVSQFILRRTFKTNMKYLPPKLEYTIFLNLTDYQVDLYTALLEEKDIVLQSEGGGRGTSYDTV